MDNLSLSSVSSDSSGDKNNFVCVIAVQPSNPTTSSTDFLEPTQGILNQEVTSSQYSKVKRWMDDWREARELTPELPRESTCIRYDFDKGPATPSVPKSCFTQAAPLFSYMEEVKKNSDCLWMNGSNIVKNQERFTPLSPESQKKELCTYLQLMEPDQKPKKLLAKHRRSGRFIRQKNEEKPRKLGKLRKIFSFKKNLKKENLPLPSPSAYSEVEKSSKLEKIVSFMKNIEEEKNLEGTLLPLPPPSAYSEVVDFEECMQDLVKDRVQKVTKNSHLKKVKKRRKFKLKFHQKPIRNRSIAKRGNLRSNGRLKNISLDRLILKKRRLKKRKLLKAFKGEKSPKENPKTISPHCEIISVHTNSDDENVDLKNFVDDMLELDKMSAEHRKSVIESRILASSSITNLVNKRVNQEADVQKAYKIFSDLSERKNSEEKENSENTDVSEIDQNDNISIEDRNEVLNFKEDIVTDFTVEHNYALSVSDDDEDESVSISLSPVPIPNIEVVPVRTQIQIKSLHNSLTQPAKHKLFLNNLHNWTSNSHTSKSNHSINISKNNGPVLSATYQDFNLVIVQQNLISFWTQSALGNVLGAQNMWIPKGGIQRIALNSMYMQTRAMDTVITTETSVAVVELWTKEHKSELRQVPMADVFANVYFWRLRQNGLEKKVLQLENIQGFAEDVQYCVLKSYPKIIVSWHAIQGLEKKTKIRSYHLAADFQTVANIGEIQPVQHYVSSLHNIEDCDGLVMGCGENKVTLWNVEYGYIVATIEMISIKPPLATHWVKCDRGFLFTIQECMDQELRLIAINGMNHSWKKLQSYSPIPGFDGLKGVCIDNGILVAYFSQGILCWNAQTGELIVEEVPNECEYVPSGKNVIMIVNENVIVRHSLSHLITDL